MEIDEYISSLRTYQNIHVTVADGELKIKASKKDLTPAVVESIRARKKEILDFFETANQVKAGITPVDYKEHYTLSHAQKRLWVIDQITDVRGLYNVTSIHNLPALDTVAFRRAVCQLLERHESLRTSFHLIDGEPRQMIHDPESIPLTSILHEKDERDFENLDEALDKERFYPFELNKIPVRILSVQKTDRSFVVLIVLHHIVTDGWSMDILYRDLSTLYNQIVSGRNTGLPKLSIQYKDYAQWQHNSVQSGNLDIARRYWKKQLSGELPVLNFPWDYQRPDVRTYDGGSVVFGLAPSQTRALMAVAKENKATLFMTLLAITNVLLYKYTGQQDLLFGLPVSGRDHADLEDQIGFYTNNLILRTPLSADDHFSKIVSIIRNALLEGTEHQSYPYDLLVDELNYTRTMNRNPVFDVMVSFTSSSQRIEDSDAQELIIRKYGICRFDIAYTFTQFANDWIQVDINYSRNLIRQEKIVRMVSHLKSIVTSVLQSPHQPLSSIRYLTEEEEKEIISVFNNTETPYNHTVSIKDLIENQVGKTPGNVCLVSETGNYTFSQFNNAANALATYLKDRFQITKGEYVGIMMDNSVERMITLLAIMKLGAAYVPIDPDYPLERRQYIIDDTKLRILLVFEIPSAKGETAANVQVVSIRESAMKLENNVAPSLEIEVGPEDIFSILYTSGSTGKPKGVLVPNRGLVNRMEWLWKRYHFGPEDVIYQKTPFVFDVSIGELFMPLCYGAKLLIAGSNTSAEIAANVEKFKVTYIHFSPTMLNGFLNSLDTIAADLSSLRYFFASGEELLKDIVSKFYKRFQIPLINLYGPTEASIEVSVYETRPQDVIIPIGKPISNTKLYILDENRGLRPVGIPGEIGIGGIGLADGYLNRPEMTAERFIPDTFWGKGTKKIYKTGDIGRWTEAGEIEFLGRRDNQTSINGSRIELGEVESAILEHAAVKDVAVMVEKDDFGNYHLVAYYVQKTSSNPVAETEKSNAGAAAFIDQANLFTKLHIQRDYNIKYPLSYLLETAALQWQSRIALIVGEKKFTYKELHETSNQLANYLQKIHAVGPGNLVGISMPRTEKLIIALLAIIKSGAAYVPIDPDYPDARIAHMLTDSKAQFVFLEQKTKASAACRSCANIGYDDFLSEIDTCSQTFRSVDLKESELLYVCYTSGSTGTPKGVMINHHNVIDYVHTFTAYFKIDEEDIVIQQASLSFDTSVEEIFPTLCAGGTLVLLENGGRDIDSMIQAMNRHNITLLSTTPLVINELNARHSEIRSFPRILISGGDLLKENHVRALIDKTQLYNTYGPTEATICTSFHRVRNIDECSHIGIPIANRWIYVLNDDMQQLPCGEVGELYIWGAGLAQGYIHQQAETTKRFIENPFVVGRLYKTGDLGAWQPDGYLTFHGRKDSQVKIKGYRIEPAEIDHAINRHGGVESSTTVVRSDAEGVLHLVVYYIARQHIAATEFRSFLAGMLPHFMVPDYFLAVSSFPRTINGKLDLTALPIPGALTLNEKMNNELRTYLKSKLPAYMVPSYFRNILALPLTVTGKVDRKELAKFRSFYETQSTFVSPGTTTEKKLSAIWEKCLKRIEIGVNDNFFEVGGNSLKATQVMGAVFKEFKKNISLKEIFNNPTIRELSLVLDGQQGDESLLIRLNNVDAVKPKLFFIPPVLGSSTIFKSLAEVLNDCYSVYGLQCAGFDTESRLDSSIEQMAEKFAGEVLSVEKNNEISLVAYSMGVAVAFEMTKLLEAQGKDVRVLFIDRGARPDKKRTPAILNRSDVDSSIERELGYWLKEIPADDKNRVKDLIFNNLQILTNYSPQGKINAKIVALEGRNTAGMDDWASHTISDLTKHEINAGHYEIFNSENHAQVVSLIRNTFTHHETVQNIRT